MRFEIMTLFPEFLETFLSYSILGRGVKAGCFSYGLHNIRDFSDNKHRNVDDTPYGGGAGMVMAAPPIVSCFEHIMGGVAPDERCRVLYLSPRGRLFDQAMAKELAGLDRLILLCGHYEGVDERAITAIGAEEVSIGDFVLSGGETAACVVTDAVARLLPGVLSEPICHEEESIASGLLEYPQYTRPYDFEGETVPEVLLSGHHERIAAWRREMALSLTRERRPDLYGAYLAAHPPKPEKKKRKRVAPEEHEGS
ncbi:MAG: tRNA (guanosine(37)-N1)-methyltransferase TrmD [Clostridia bacterium]|nr:tRNA (guanosine(37)-N1)-methyltransferase TrmD [Clostridia bacterium]